MSPHMRVLLWGGLVLVCLCGACSPDCEWSGTGVAWVDENGDGVRDPDEPPLSGVILHLSDTLNGVHDVAGPSVTNWKGEATLSVFLPGCPRVHLELRLDIPDGYRLTTPAQVAVKQREGEQVYGFGLAYLPGIPTVTPLPPAPVCTTHRLGEASEMHVTGLAVDHDGTLWISTYPNGVKSYDRNRDVWHDYTHANGLVDDRVRSVTVADGGAVWFATDGGVSRFDGRAWTSYTVADGLADPVVFNVSFAPDGAVWLGTFNGISQLSPSTGEWTSYAAEDGVKEKDAIQVAAMPDGSIWYLTTTSTIYRSALPEQAGERRRWTVPPNYRSEMRTLYGSKDAGVGRDGAYWFVGLAGINRFDPVTEQWTTYDERSTKGVYRGWGHALDVAPDGSIWIAAGLRSTLIYRLVLDLQVGNAIDWQVYDQRDLFPERIAGQEGVAAHTIAAAASDTIWFATYDSVTRCIFQE